MSLLVLHCCVHPRQVLLGEVLVLLLIPVVFRPHDSTRFGQLISLFCERSPQLAFQILLSNIQLIEVRPTSRFVNLSPVCITRVHHGL